MEGKNVKLMSSDDKIYEVPDTILKKSTLLKELTTDNEGEVITLKEVNEECLKRIIEYLYHYKDFEPKEIPKPFPENCDANFLRSILNDEWTFNFLNNLSIEDTINMVNASNYLQIDGLTNLLSAKLAYELINCSVEEAKQKFQIPDDFPPNKIIFSKHIYILIVSILLLVLLYYY